MLSGMISIRSCRPFSFSACLRMSSEICSFVKCIVCIFSGLVTPKLQTSGLTRKGRPFFTDYQTHFLRWYHVLLVAAAYNFKRTMKALCCMHQKSMRDTVFEQYLAKRAFLGTTRAFSNKWFCHIQLQGLVNLISYLDMLLINQTLQYQCHY